jgi:hypothetical protein
MEACAISRRALSAILVNHRRRLRGSFGVRHLRRKRFIIDAMTSAIDAQDEALTAANSGTGMSVRYSLPTA